MAFGPVCGGVDLVCVPVSVQATPETALETRSRITKAAIKNGGKVSTAQHVRPRSVFCLLRTSIGEVVHDCEVALVRALDRLEFSFG